MILFALYTAALIFCAFMCARAHYRRRIADLEGQMALWRILRNDAVPRAKILR
jgi:hypothetical protein